MRRTLLFGMGVGAVLMYYFDPSWGRRRRAQLRDRLEQGAAQLDELREASERPRVHTQANGRSREDDAIDWTTGYSYRERVIQTTDLE